jgi:hypothetical protein
VSIPGVLVVGSVLAIVGNIAWAKLEKQAGRRGTARTSVQPEHERRLGRVGARLKEPKYSMNSYPDMKTEQNIPEKQMFIVTNIQITTVLLDVGVTELGLLDTNLITWERRVAEALVWGCG